MYCALLTAITMFAMPMAFSQSVDQPAEKKPAPRMLIKAKCALPDGRVVGQQLIEVDASLSAQEKRARAEAACRPVMAEANSRCDDLASRVGDLKSQWRIAAPHSSQELALQKSIKQALATAPAYCTDHTNETASSRAR